MLYKNLDLLIKKSDAGVYEWEAVASTTDEDNYKDKTSIDLFSKWIGRAAKTEKAEGWLPAASPHPYLSIAHYPSLGGELAAGTTLWMGVIGDKFVAKGVINDNPVGRAVIENYSPDKNIKISAGWWDIEHRHGDFVFRRKSMGDVCPLCQNGESKQYIDGQLEHFALTSVPVNPNTSFVLEEKSMKKKITRLDDAATIVGDEVASSIDAAYKAAVTRSTADDELDNALVVRSATKTINGDEFEPGDFLVVGDEKKPSTWHLPVKRMGKIDHRLMGAAKAALTVGYRGNKYQGEGAEEALKKLKALYKAEKMIWKSEVNMEEVQKQEVEAVDKNEAVAEAVADEFVEESDNQEVVGTSEEVAADDAEVELSDAEDAISESSIVFRAVELGDQLDAVLKSGAPRSAQLSAIDEVVNAFALEVRSIAENSTPTDPISELEDKLSETQNNVAAISQSMATMLDRLKVLTDLVSDAMTQKNSEAQTGEQATMAQPEQRSMTAPPTHPVSRMNPEGGHMSLRDIVNRSVGLQ